MSIHRNTVPRVCKNCHKDFLARPDRVKYGGAIFCSKHCSGRYSMSHFTIDDYFWRYVEKTDSCWIWTGTISKSGYGVVNVNKLHHRAHRFSYETFKGPIPEGMCVCHRCDTPPCVNPEHLFLGTPAENRWDCCQKQRMARGEKQHLAKLREDQVREIRRRYEQDGVSMYRLAKDYGVGDTTIKGVVDRTTWKHVLP